MNFEFWRDFRLEETVEVWPVSCFGWKPPLLIPSYLTSGLPAPRRYVNKTPQSITHWHASVYVEQPRGITSLAGFREQTQDLPRGNPVTWPLGHRNCAVGLTWTWNWIFVKPFLNPILFFGIDLSIERHKHTQGRPVYHSAGVQTVHSMKLLGLLVSITLLWMHVVGKWTCG